MEYTVICKSCNNRVSIGDLKADKSGSGWICLDCYKGQHPQVYKQQKPLRLRPEPVVQPKPQKVKYYCTDCGYKFYKDINVGQKYQSKCPYCNLYTIRPEKDADTILRETIGESSLRFTRTDIIDDDN